MRSALAQIMLVDNSSLRQALKIILRTAPDLRDELQLSSEDFEHRLRKALLATFENHGSAGVVPEKFVDLVIPLVVAGKVSRALKVVDAIDDAVSPGGAALVLGGCGGLLIGALVLFAVVVAAAVKTLGI